MNDRHWNRLDCLFALLFYGTTFFMKVSFFSEECQEFLRNFTVSRYKLSENKGCFVSDIIELQFKSQLILCRNASRQMLFFNRKRPNFTMRNSTDFCHALEHLKSINSILSTWNWKELWIWTAIFRWLSHATFPLFVCSSWVLIYHKSKVGVPSCSFMERIIHANRIPSRFCHKVYDAIQKL